MWYARVSAIFPRAIVLSLPSIKNEILFTMPGCYHLQANLKRQHSQSQRVLGKTMCSGSNFAFQCTDNEISFLQGFSFVQLSFHFSVCTS